MLTIAVDCDETIADLMAEWLRRYNRDFNDNLTKDQIKTWEIEEYVKPEARTKIFEYLQYPDLYDFVQPIPGAKEGLAYLRAQGFKVVIVSSCVLNQTDMKMNWCVKHGMVKPLHTNDRVVPDFVGMTDKSLILADAMIDDRLKNLTDVH